MGKASAPTAAAVLLVVDDDHAMRSLLSDELWDLGYRIVEAADGDRGFEENRGILTGHHHDRPADGGRWTRLCFPPTHDGPWRPIVLMTAFGDPTVRSEALRAGVSAFFNKPVRISEIKAAIEGLLGRKGFGSASPSA